MIQNFFVAYNPHDIQGVLASLATQFVYADCDYVRDMPAYISARPEMITWLRARFGEHDRFEVTSIFRTRGIARALLDAYNAHISGRVLQMVSGHVAYRDRASVGSKEIVLKGTSPLCMWLRARFRAGDGFDQIAITVGAGRRTNVAPVQAFRRDRSPAGANLAPDAATITLVIGNKRADQVTIVARPS